MPRYNVHLYREMRVRYRDVIADTPQHAATIVKDIDPELCDYENDIVECEGQSFAAIVDELVEPEVGSDDVACETPLQFEYGALRDAATLLLNACDSALARLSEQYKNTFDSRMDNDPLVIELRQALKNARAYDITS